MQEANVVINGVRLSIGQALTLRVAVTGFLERMQDEGLTDDEQGRAMAAAYILRASEVEALLTEPQPEDPA